MTISALLEQKAICTVYGMPFILWSKLIVKKSCNKKSLGVATYCLAKYWWRTKRLICITTELPWGLLSQETLYYDKVTRLKCNSLSHVSAYFMCVLEKYVCSVCVCVYPQKKSHHSDQLIQRQYPKTTDDINAPQNVYKSRLRVIWSYI